MRPTSPRVWPISPDAAADRQWVVIDGPRYVGRIGARWGRTAPDGGLAAREQFRDAEREIE